MTRPPDARPPAAHLRQALEARHTFERLVELRLDPVGGRFDAAHLREIHRRIFQDLPGLGFDDVTPGLYRRPVAPGGDWVKSRRLETADVPSSVAYSSMDGAAVARLDRVLEGVDPSALCTLATADFTRAIGSLYAELDYIHPFADGNSRTLREFTRELADAAGYTLAWERFARSPAGRDVLYIARDRSVNALALAHIQDHGTRRDILLSMDRYERNRDLPDLLRDAIRPSRAIAFEQLAQVEALGAHPELGEAFESIGAAARYFETKLAGDTETQHRALMPVRQHIQKQLDEGRTQGLGRSMAERQATHAAPSGPDGSAPRDVRDDERGPRGGR